MARESSSTPVLIKALQKNDSTRFLEELEGIQDTSIYPVIFETSYEILRDAAEEVAQNFPQENPSWNIYHELEAIDYDRESQDPTSIEELINIIKRHQTTQPTLKSLIKPIRTLIS